MNENDYVLYELNWNNGDHNVYTYIDCSIEILCDEWGQSTTSRKERLYNEYIEGSKNYAFINSNINTVIGYATLKRGINKQHQGHTQVVILYNAVIRKDYRLVHISQYHI